MLVAPVVGSPPVVGSSPLEPVALTPEGALEVGAASVVPTSATDELSEPAEVVAPLSLALAPPPPPQPASTTNPTSPIPYRMSQWTGRAPALSTGESAPRAKL
ncbi:hypothetical protein [Nannocystis sp.]|uniref:hypothetical protein n=1 Tax=Nannocystis sp. TaxID=1962667 RepID=UPI0025D8058A|nr:hypothetical protein [Nannocystis sp.]MBK7823697.1 hypothetical protein [Nannocystis sp.]